MYSVMTEVYQLQTRNPWFHACMIHASYSNYIFKHVLAIYGSGDTIYGGDDTIYGVDDTVYSNYIQT